jgi:hypothetical protein
MGERIKPEHDLILRNLQKNSVFKAELLNNKLEE